MRNEKRKVYYFKNRGRILKLQKEQRARKASVLISLPGYEVPAL
jgi:hypothetical protein